MKKLLRRRESPAGLPAVLGVLADPDDAEAASDVAARIHAATLTRPLSRIALVPAVGDEPVADVVLALARALDADGVSTAVIGPASGEDAEKRADALAQHNDFVLLAATSPDEALPFADAVVLVARDEAGLRAARPGAAEVLGAVLVASGERSEGSTRSLEDPGDLAERELAARAAELELRESAVRRTEDEVAAEGAQAAQLARRAEQLDERERELDERERRLEQLAARLEGRQRALEKATADLTARAKAAAAAPQAPPEPAASAPPSAVARLGRLDRLEELVARNAAAHPDRVPEWEAYLFTLRQYADSAGVIPSRLSGLVDEVFGDLT